MKKMRDPAIKLFGKEIALAVTGGAPAVSGDVSAGDERVIKTGDEKQGKEKDGLETNKELQHHNSPTRMEEDETPYDPEDDPKTPPILEDNEKSLENENDQNETNSLDQKPLKKPDKILPCPRCNSMDTKFCYYNNYNVNQPRHFCKGCQRYWTAGGTTRNVPVGAGRRKNKNSAPHFRHVTISEPTNATVLSFETSKNNSIFRNKIFEAEKGSDCSSGNSVITNSSEGRIGIPWPYPAMYPIPVYPIPYWNCGYPIPIYNPNIPTNSSLGKHSRNGELFNPINANNNNDKELEEPRILIPKTLRIDDPDEAAKSSIWATLGIKNDLINRKGIFKAFEPKGDGKKNCLPETPELMRANPAAMSRSVNFQEMS